MNKYNEHVKESIDYFNHELECRKQQVSDSSFQTTLRLAKEKTAYETAVECLKKQLPQSPVKSIHKLLSMKTEVINHTHGEKASARCGNVRAVETRCGVA